MSDGDDIEDIEACARAGRRPRDAGPYRVMVGDAMLRFRPVIVPGPVSTGRTLRELAALHPPEGHVCFAVLTDGLLEEIRLDETVDLRAGVEKLMACASDRLFRFTINGAEYQWGGAFISGAMLLKLAKADPDTHTVALREPDGSLRPLERTGLIDLAAPGVEAFVVAPRG